MTHSFAESQQAGLIAMMSIGNAPAPVRPGSLTRQPDSGAHARKENRAARSSHMLARLPGLSLVAILTAQAVLSLRLIRIYTAFTDEALYISAGRLELSHWLHGTPVPPYQAYFSGAPVIYPPLSALANSVGGLAGARILSLCFMLGATVLLWSTASRLYGWQTASFAAGFWVVLGPTQHLGAYATFDAMALFLLALAAWCATGRRDKDDATAWIVAASVALALANATKYASAIFDPVVIALAIVSAWPHPGGKIAVRRGTLLTACVIGSLALLVRLGGPLYLRGIEQTTIERTSDTASVLTVLGQSWAWVGSVAVIAGIAVVLSWRRPERALTAFLASAVLLVPMEQARIHTLTSLNKHVDFGAWFAAIAAGYAIHRIVKLLRPRLVRAGVVGACVIGLLAASQAGALQARNMTNGYWPNEAALIRTLSKMTAHGGRFLAEDQTVPEYYLPDTNWQQWSNTRNVIYPDGRTVSVAVGAQGNPALYKYLIDTHYFSVVLLTFTDTVALDGDIARDLHLTHGYRYMTVPFGPTGFGHYDIWYLSGTGRGRT